MDFTNALILTGAAYGAIELVLVLVAWAFTKGDAGRIPAGAKALVCLGVGIAVTFLVASSEWGADVHIAPGGKALDVVSGGGLILIGLGLAILEAGAFSVINKATNAWSNSGVPMPSAAQREALDTGAMRSLELWAEAGHGDTAPPAA